MNDAELNRRLAEALGFEMLVEESGDVFVFPNELPFSPATDRNHLAEYVLPEVGRRGLWRVLSENLEYAWAHSEVQTLGEFLLASSPRVLASAALKVLEASHE